MRSILPAFLILTPACLIAAGELPIPPKKLSSISLLPDGSELHGVMLPRYDENRRLTGVLKAKAMTLLSAQEVAGVAVSIEFFNPDASPRGRVDLARALFNQSKGTLEAREPVTLQSDRISAKGTGLVYAIEQGEGFLLGPATTWIQAPIETTMNSTHSPLRAVGMAGISLLTSPLNAAPPPVLSGAERVALQGDAASKATAANEASSQSRKDLAADARDAAAASDSAGKFLVQAGIPVAKTATLPDTATPLDVKPGPGDTVVECDGGMYFDSDEGVFVYLKNVRVTDPRFSLSGANELKIFLGKKPVDSPQKAEKKDKKSLGLGSKFGDVERIVATGAVRIVQNEVEKGKDPVEASGAIFSYHPKTGQIILSGGYPWVKQGSSFMRAKQPDLNLRILKTGSFVTEGNWDMGGNLNPE